MVRGFVLTLRRQHRLLSSIPLSYPVHHLASRSASVASRPIATMSPSVPPVPTSPPGREAFPVTLLTDRLEKPSLDDRDYRVVRLQNGLEALLVHDPETDKASAALDVNVGNFSDEDGMPGMAHAVEHLLFMGTKKFPVENEYGQYLSSNSGSSNAYTASTSTNYFFDVAAKPANDQEPNETNPSPLYGALDRFAQFFIEPLFLSSTLDRELKAVDSENKKNLQSDVWRLHQLDKSLSNPKHPYCHFSTGNFEVLKTIPESEGINVRDKFIEFHAKHYSANRMKLVVLGREPLGVLQKWVADLFSPVVNKNLPPNRWADEPPFRPNDLGIQWFAKPVMDTRELELVFPFIDEEELFESQPSRYISHLIGHEGPGSIMAHIKCKGWANGLSAGAYPVCHGSPGIFNVQIRLTEEGLKNYPEIVKIFFQYVALLRETGPQEWIFDEQKGMADVDFKFRQKTPASRFTSKISSVMQRPLPREWLLSGHSRLRQFNAALIEQALDKLRPENMRLTVISRKFPGDWNKKEKWYGTEYRLEIIPKSDMADYQKAAGVSKTDRLRKLHLPHKNNFIPNKLEVEKKEVSEPAISPRLLRNDMEARTWWKKDDTFWVPKANVIVSLKNPIIHATAENSVKARLFAELVRDALEEYSYDAELAGLQYTVSLDSRGLFLDVSGYNDKLHVLLEQVAVTMRDINIKEDRFDIVKERLTRGYDNWQLQSSYQQVGDYMAWLNAERDFVVEEMAEELKGVTVEAVREFHRQMLARLYIEVYVHGNMYRGDAIKVTDLLTSSFKARTLPRNQWPIIRSLILPPGANYVFNKTLKDPANVNHCIETTFLIGDRGDRAVRARTLLVDQMVHEPAFDQLRTKEQLGYIVFAGMRNFATRCGFRFLIQSERTPDYLDRRIEAFLIQFSSTLENMSDADFEGHKRSLINKRLEKLRNLDQESSRHWVQVSNEYYDFEQAQLDAAHVKTLTKAEMVEFFNSFLHPSSKQRSRVSVHLHARGAVERDGKVASVLEENGFTGVPYEDRQSLDILEAFLTKEHKTSESDLETIIAKVKELGVSKAAQTKDSETPSTMNGVSAVDTAVEIKDIRKYKGALLASSGARPVRELSEFEDNDPKLFAVFPAIAYAPELPAPRAAHTFKTSSSKKRKLAARPSTKHPDPPGSSSPAADTALPSCEVEDDTALSFTSTTSAALPPRLGSPSYLRADSHPASSLPARLQHPGNQQAPNSLVSSEYASSAASSPCASAYADLSLDSEAAVDEAGSALNQPRSQSPFRVSRRAIMNGDTDLPQRSSSPLKRRASSMDPDPEPTKNGDADANMDHSAESHHDATQMSRAMSVDMPDADDGAAAATQPPPPVSEQIKIIETLLKAFEDAPIQEDDVAYLVSKSWVDQALALRAHAKSSKEESGVTPLGPVDNSDIIQDILTQPDGTLFTRLRPDADLDSFTLFPDDAWKLVMEWYGLKKGQQPIVRTAINTALDNLSEPNILYEFHPPIFRVHRLWSENSPIPIEQTIKAKNPPPLVVARSRKAHAQNFLKDIKTWSGIALNRRVQIYSITEPIPTPPAQETRPALTPPDSPGRTDGQASGNAWPHLLLDLVSFAAVRNTRQHLRMQDHTCDKKYNGKSTLHHQELTTDQTLILDEYIDNKNLVSKYTGKSQPAGKGIPNRGQASALSSRPTSTRSSPAAEGVMTRGRAHKKKLGRTVGSVGLHNLGNTCYMNSALQCVRSVEELTKFFITDAYQDEVNKTNLLGYNGRMAMAYGNLLKDIYREDRGSVSPRDFKSTVGRCRSTFSGWGQQDSQEFLGFLLDALQEDLSRVKKKPYIEKPDSTDDMIDDPVAIREMAEKVWDITRQRDDSVIADLFTGMYKSTLKCPECGKISITFDPFNNLTLPLPLESVWNKTVKFFPLNDVPVKIEVELPKHSSIEALKHFISLRTGVPVDRLMGAEEFKDRFFKIYDNTQDISEEIQQSDIPTIHELEAVPTNWPAKAQRKMYRSMLDIDTPAATSDYDDPRYETMVVPVLHKRESAYGGPGVSPPHFISLTKQEASSFDAIQRKVLERVATFSTWSRLANACNGNAANGADNDMVLTNTSDADSSADGKVAARSVEGEDDMVDVTMKDGTEETPSANPFGPPKILRKFKKSRAKFVDPDVFLIPELQNLFQLKYFKSQSDGAIPTGWSSLDNNRSLPNLTDRLPDSSTKDEAASTPESSNATGPSEGEESNNEDGGAKEDAAGQTRMAEEESSEGDESDAEPVTQRSAGPRAQPKHGRGKKKPKQHKAYTKRDNKRSEKQMRSAKHSTVSAQPVPPAVADGGPLVRLYEGIVVEWNDDAWETVFGNTSSTYNAEQGGRTFTDMEVLQDSAIKINQRRRQNRKSRGISLEECLDEFERAEILSEQDMWYCPRCKEHRRASKKFDLWKTPDYLVAHLKRFSSTGWRRDKLDVLVDFPIEGLDLTSRVIHKEDGKSEVYDLIAVDDHYGGLGGGHYTAYAKNFVDGKWYNYNDSSVSQVSDPSSAVTSAAYLLFYRRRSSGHLGGPRFSQILEKYERDTTEDENEESGNEARRGGRERDSDDDAPPVYDEPTFDSIRRSIEDDDAASSNNGRNGRVKSLDMTQNWSFNGLDSGAEFSTGGDAASDVAQADDSSGEEGGNSSQGYFEGDTAMASGGREHDERVMSILNEVSMYDGSDDVAEIHLEDGKSNE